MKNSNKLLCKIFMIFSFLLLFPRLLHSQHWYRISENERQYSEIDVSSIKRNKKIVTVWVKTGYKTKNAKEYYIDRKVENIKKHGANINKSTWENWGYSVILQELNCSARTLKMKSITEYNEDGSVIHRLDFDKNNQIIMDVVPGSTADDILYVLCKTYSLDYYGKEYNLFLEDAHNFLMNNKEAVIIE